VNTGVEFSGFLRESLFTAHRSSSQLLVKTKYKNNFIPRFPKWSGMLASDLAHSWASCDLTVTVPTSHRIIVSQRKGTASYRCTASVWERTGSRSKLQENNRTFERNQWKTTTIFLYNKKNQPKDHRNMSPGALGKPRGFLTDDGPKSPHRAPLLCLQM
jgi:hypothetical protein